MLNITQEGTNSYSSAEDLGKQTNVLNNYHQETNLEFHDEDDISPHYNDGIMDLEESIENLRKLLQIKEKNSVISTEDDHANHNFTRYSHRVYFFLINLS